MPVVQRAALFEEKGNIISAERARQKLADPF
jgi:hypothetical protein